MSTEIFLFTPPFTQLNTPYPATAYLKGFLNTKKISSFQADLGIEVILALFPQKGITDLFDYIGLHGRDLSANAKRILSFRPDYIATIDPVVSFLHGKNPTLAHLIGQRNFLPEAERFTQLSDLSWAFGSMGYRTRQNISPLYTSRIFLIW